MPKTKQLFAAIVHLTDGPRGFVPVSDLAEAKRMVEEACAAKFKRRTYVHSYWATSDPLPGFPEGKHIYIVTGNAHRLLAAVELDISSD